MYTLNIKLKQHTPLIHFQHDQEGATLRATEVKPKLDRFLITEVFGEDFERCKKFLVGYTPQNEEKIRKKFEENNFRALDYKMRIECEGEERKEYLLGSGSYGNLILPNDCRNLTIIGNTAFFAQEKVINKFKNGNGKSCATFRKEQWNLIEKKGLMWSSVSASIFSKHSSLLDEIKTICVRFFASQNFGTRQSKGFGCFSVEKIDDQQVLNINDFETALKTYFKSYYKKRLPQKDLSEILGEISYDYKILKSGYNFNKEYYKSKLFFWGVDRDPQNPVRWEKRFLKKEIKAWLEMAGIPYKLKYEHPPIYDSGIHDKGWDDLEDYTYMYLRAVLGLAENFEFLTNDKRVKVIAQVEFLDIKTDLPVPKEEVQRFASPLLFKVYDNCIYLVVNGNTDPLRNYRVRFHLSLKGCPAPYNNYKKITTPISISQINLQQFLEYSLAYEPFEANDKDLHYTLH